MLCKYAATRLTAMVFGIFALAAQAGASTHVATADSFTRNNNPSTNYGSDATVRVQPWGNGTGF